jgi:hypothetical protein
MGPSSGHDEVAVDVDRPAGEPHARDSSIGATIVAESERSPAEDMRMHTRRRALAAGWLVLLAGFALPGGSDVQGQPARKGGRVVVVSPQEPKTLLPTSIC